MKVYPIYVDYPLDELILHDTYDYIYDKIKEGIEEIIDEDHERIADLDFSITSSPYDDMIDDLITNNAKAVIKINDQHEVSFTGNIKAGNKIIPSKELEKLLDQMLIEVTYKSVWARYPAHMSEYDIRYGTPEPADWSYDDEKLTLRLDDITSVYFHDVIDMPSEEKLLNYLEQEEQKDAGDFVR